MSTFSRFAVAMAIAVCIVRPATAGGGMTGGSTEVTQILNNGELVAQVRQQIATVQQLVQTYQVTYQQLQQQILAGAKIGDVSLGDVLKMKQDLEGYQASLRGLNGDLGSLGQIFDTRITEARLSKMTLEDYVRRESARVQQGNALAKARVNREVAQAQQVRSDIELVRLMGDKIGGTVGVHASTQLLNSQMNLMLQQMTRLVAATNEAQGSDRARIEQQEAEDRAERAGVYDQITAAQRAQKERDKAAIDALRSRK